MTALPTGTVTFLFTDLEGSTRLWEQFPEAMKGALARHDEILRDAIEAGDGHIVKTTGDGVHAAFADPTRAIGAAAEAQRALQGEPWSETGSLRVRMGIHTGPVEHRDGDYYGTAVNRAARIMSVANGGQILVSLATEELVRDVLPEDTDLRDLGEHRLRDLARAERVFQVTAAGLASDFPTVRSLDAFPGNLPVQATAFVGRDDEVEDLVERVRDAKVVTLTGVGGVGKTRLALQVAAELLPSFRDGVWLVELAGVGSADGVLDAVASAVGFSAAAPGSSGILEYLQAKVLLLVVDNCEHLLVAVAALVEQLVRTAPYVRVLATSREGLGVAGEHLRAVPSMGLPAASASAEAIAAADSVRLFVQRAGEASASYRLTDQDAGAVGELCRRLDGIPLAIELAAARVPTLTPEEIAAHLDRRFKLLTAGRRVAVTRHQTLRNAIEWSYQLLDPDEQAVLDRLSIFAGGFDLPAAQAVAATGEIDEIEVLDVLARLVAKSLVVAEPRDGATRYRLLETVRDYAWERLQDAGATADTARRHAVFFARFAQNAGAGLKEPDEADWRDRVEGEIDNLRAALAWAITVGDVELALQPVADLAVLGDHLAPHGRLAADAAAIAPDHPLSALALGVACYAAALQGDVDASVQLGDAARARAATLDRSPKSSWVRCRVANATCVTTGLTGEPSEDFGREWLADARELDDAWCLVEVLTYITALPDRERGTAAGEEALLLARRIGAPSRVAFAAALLASVIAEDDPERAEQLLREAAVGAAASRNGSVDYVAAMAVVSLHVNVGALRAAADACLDAIESSAERRAPDQVLQFVTTLACLLATMDDAEGALVLDAWGEQRGLPARSTNRLIAGGYGARELGDTYAAAAPAELERFRSAATDLDDAGMFDFARERVARLLTD